MSCDDKEKRFRTATDYQISQTTGRTSSQQRKILHRTLVTTPLSHGEDKKKAKGGLLGKWGTSLEIGQTTPQENEWARLSTANDYK